MRLSPGNSTLIQYSRQSSIEGLELYRSLHDTRFVSRHVHELLCLTIAESGVRICETRKGRDILTPGIVFVSSFSEAHSSAVPTGQSYACRSLRLTPALTNRLLRFLKGPSLNSLGFSQPLIDDAELYGKILNFHVSTYQNPSSLEQECRLFDLFSDLLLRHADCRTSYGNLGEERSRIWRICNYLRENYCNNVSIEDLADIAQLSPYYCCRVFEKVVGVPPHVYLLDIRLTRAAQKLACGNRIADVAAEVGFFDQSHFHKAFLRKFGVTPRQYQIS